MEVVELLDSDSETEESRPPRPVQRRSSAGVASAKDTIDLCDSSDDDDDKKPAAKKQPPAKKPQPSSSRGSARRVSAPTSNHNKRTSSDDDDDDEKLLQGGPVFSTRKPAPASGSHRRASENDQARMISQPSAAAASRQPDKEDDDDVVLLCSSRSADDSHKKRSAFASSRKVLHRSYDNHHKSAAAAMPPRKQQSNDSDDDDDDALLHEPSGLNLKPSAAAASSTKPAAASSSQKKIINNPYNNSRVSLASSSDSPPTGSSSQGRKSMNNPYKSRPSLASSSDSSPTGSTSSSSARRGQASAANGNSDDMQFVYPRLLQNSKQHDDLRARIALACWKHSRSLVSQSHHRPKLVHNMRRVVDLAVLEEFPIRSVEEYIGFGQNSVNSSQNTRQDLRQELTAGGFEKIKTPVTEAWSGRQYYTIAEACLVALLAHVEQILPILCIDQRMFHRISEEKRSEHLVKEDLWMPLEHLLPAVDQLLRPECPGHLTRKHMDDHGASHYLEPSTRSAEFMQITTLERERSEKGPWIKRHRRQGHCLYELLPTGYHAALFVRTRRFPEPKGHYRCSRIATTSQIDPKYKGICLGVDTREGGGAGNVLHKFCSKLDMKCVPYFVGSLNIGDYYFFTTKDGGKTLAGPMDYLCPILIERKSVEDVAHSIHDGRWQNQKRRMYVGQYVFGYDNCRMVYIIEGNKNAQTVTGNMVGNRWSGVDVKKLDEEIENLKAEGFEVIQTPSRENTMFTLSRWAERVAIEMKTGALKAQYTFTEFKAKCNQVGNVDFSRIAKYHMRNKLEAAEAAKRAANSETSFSPENASASASSKKKKKKGPSSADGKSSKKQKVSVDNSKYVGLSKKKLEAECVAVGLPKTGNRSDLIERLLGPHPPRAWLERKKRGEYVPQRHDVGGTALLVALYLHEREVGRDNGGMTKDELYNATEELNITKNPFSGGTTQTGPFLYDGWSNMGQLLAGDPALVVKKKGKHKLTSSCDIAGFAVAKAMHGWCHAHGNCPCGKAEEYD